MGSSTMDDSLLQLIWLASAFYLLPRFSKSAIGNGMIILVSGLALGWLKLSHSSTLPISRVVVLMLMIAVITYVSVVLTRRMHSSK